MSHLTPEQQAADLALEAAIKQTHEAYWSGQSILNAEQSVLVEYVLVYAVRGFTDDGEDVFIESVIIPDRTSIYAAMGLANYARIDLEQQQIARAVKDGDEDV